MEVLVLFLILELYGNEDVLEVVFVVVLFGYYISRISMLVENDVLICELVRLLVFDVVVMFWNMFMVFFRKKVGGKIKWEIIVIVEGICEVFIDVVC